MEDIIKYFLQISAVGTLVGIIVIWIGKLLIQKEADIHIKRIEQETQLQLNKLEFEHKERFSNIYSSQLKAIRKTYNLFYKLETSLISFQKLMEQETIDPTNRDNSISEINDIVDSLKSNLENNRLYFEEVVIERMVSLMSKYGQVLNTAKLSKAKVTFHPDSKLEGKITDVSFQSSMIKNSKEFLRNVEKERKNLANIFRNIIGS